MLAATCVVRVDSVMDGWMANCRSNRKQPCLNPDGCGLAADAGKKRARRARVGCSAWRNAAVVPHVGSKCRQAGGGRSHTAARMCGKLERLALEARALGAEEQGPNGVARARCAVSDPTRWQITI